MFIQNVAYVDIPKGNFKQSKDMMLISICDSDSMFHHPKTSFPFRIRHDIEFNDVEDPKEPSACTQHQANDLVRWLQEAKDLKLDVIVHCTAGLCRSGAVVEVGVGFMGFEDTGTVRIPNQLVKQRMLLTLLGENEQRFTFNGS